VEPHTGRMQGRGVGVGAAVNVSRTLVLTGLALWLTACGNGSGPHSGPTAAPVTLDPALGEVFTPSSPPVDQAAYLTAGAAYAAAFPQHPQPPSDVAAAFGRLTMMSGPTGSLDNTYKAKGVAAWGSSQPGCMPTHGPLPVGPGGPPHATDSSSQERSPSSTGACMLWSIVNASDGHLIDITNRQMP
jgi:hypothetical protein